jgi:hypothetical protein
MGDLFKAILIRHDLVHRNGKMKDGGEHVMSEENVKSLIEQANKFISHIDNQWAKISMAGNRAGSDFEWEP